MAALDPFTARRLVRFVEEFRSGQGQLPTLKDFEAGGFGREVVESAVRDRLIEKFYVTLTNGTVVKGYKVLRT
jgi:hypothetical protein